MSHLGKVGRQPPKDSFARPKIGGLAAGAVGQNRGAFLGFPGSASPRSHRTRRAGRSAAVAYAHYTAPGVASDGRPRLDMVIYSVTLCGVAQCCDVTIR